MEHKPFAIRNFSIIAHIDSGKSTLADRMLEKTGAVGSKKITPQFLDSMELEREKGITIKLKPVRIELDFDKNQDLKIIRQRTNPSFGGKITELKIPDSKFILNLVDTPGHVDFSYEVSRSLAAVEGAILLVDATQGVQAQTLANLELARKQRLTIIPVINKIDSPLAEVEKTEKEIMTLLDVPSEGIIKISAKNGTNVDQVFQAIIEKIPPPSVENDKPLRALIFDSEYDPFKGVIAFVRVVSGVVTDKDNITLMSARENSEAKEVGYLNPEYSPQQKLLAGEIGYIATGIKEPGKVRAGDTITELIVESSKSKVEALPGYQEPKPMVFASLYPENADEFDVLKVALEKLKLNDPSLVFEQETKEALGRGFNCGFLGTLHIEIISERLGREFGLSLVISTPSVAYKIIDKKGRETFVYSAVDWPDATSIRTTEEPWVSLELITPVAYLGKIMEILKNAKGVYVGINYLNQERAVITFELPLRSVISRLYDKIKTVSQGYASMNYKIIRYRAGNLVKLEIYVAGHKEEAFSKIVSEEDAYQEGKRIVEKLKNVLPQEQFSVALQAAVGGKIIARETISARRKDVTGYLYGGDVTRKRKLLEKQKKGKKLLKAKGRVHVPTKAFLEIFRV